MHVNVCAEMMVDRICKISIMKYCNNADLEIGFLWKIEEITQFNDRYS